MKKFLTLVLLLSFALPLAGCGDPCKEDPLTKLGDSLATLGKSGTEKDKVMLERKAERAAKCAEKEGGKMKKDLGF
jgi:hypothetical protein